MAKDALKPNPDGLNGNPGNGNNGGGETSNEPPKEKFFVRLKKTANKVVHNPVVTAIAGLFVGAGAVLAGEALIGRRRHSDYIPVNQLVEAEDLGEEYIEPEEEPIEIEEEV